MTARNPDAENHDPHRCRDDHASSASHLLLLTWLVPALYVLSVGPAAKIVDHHHYPRLENALGAFYYPLAKLAQHSTAAGNFFHWYIEKVWHTTA